MNPNLQRRSASSSYPFEQSVQLALGLSLSALAALDLATIPAPFTQSDQECIGSGCYHRLAAEPAE